MCALSATPKRRFTEILLLGLMVWNLGILHPPIHCPGSDRAANVNNLKDVGKGWADIEGYASPC